MSNHFGRYKQGSPYSYTLGAFPTIELLCSRPSTLVQVFVSSKLKEDHPQLFEGCRLHGIPIAVDDRMIERMSPKDNCYAVGVFAKYESVISPVDPHVALVNASDMGNLGTIIRTILGFGIMDLALIKPSVDIFHPKVVRASMGALFKLRVQYFDSFTAYRACHPAHRIFAFMLDGDESIHRISAPIDVFSLVFGNEAKGLDPAFKGYGSSVIIPQTNAVDSLNLAVSVGIAAYHFTRNGVIDSD